MRWSKPASDVLGAAAGGTDLVARTHGLSNAAQQVAMVWREVPVPVIAAVHGVAFGGGLQVALGADIRLVAADTKLSVMEIKWGLVPDMAGMVLMRELARTDVVRELTFTGRIFSGEEAVRLGLATRVAGTRRYSQEPRRDPRRQAAAERLARAQCRRVADRRVDRAAGAHRQPEPARSREGQHRAARAAVQRAGLSFSRSLFSSSSR